MFFFKHTLLSVTLLALSVTARENVSRNGKVVYFQTNEPNNSVVAIPIAYNGTLFGGVSTSTRGSGGDSIDAATNEPAAQDALSSQSSVTIAGNYLFAVNAGSNSLSMFEISDWDPTQLTLVGEPLIVPGQFPVTVAASRRNHLVCVGSSGSEAGISCGPYSPQGLGQFSPLLAFNLNQTTPPQGPTNGVAEVFFSEDETRLFTTVKGDPASNKTGFFSVLPIESFYSYPGAHDVRNYLNGTEVLFGSALIPDTPNILVTDASFGAVLVQLNSFTNEVSLLAKEIIPGQSATCWAAYSKERNSVYVTDAVVNRLIELSTDNATILSTIDVASDGPGLLELQVAGRYIYALSPGNGTGSAEINVVDSFLGKQIQNFRLDTLGAGRRSEGMAILE